MKNRDADLATALMEVIPRAMREIKASNRFYSGEVLKLPQFRVLANIWRQPKTNKELADDIGLSVAAMSRIIGHLEKKKLLQKIQNPRDRREAHVKITRQGLHLYNQIRAKTGKKIQQRIAKLNESEKNILEKSFSLIARISEPAP